MHLSLMKSSPLRVRDQQYISLRSSYSRTSSIHSTRNPLVACGMGNLCEKSFSLVCFGDEFLLYKCRTHKPCYNLEKNGKSIYIGIHLQRNEPDMDKEDKKLTHNCIRSMNSWYLLVFQSKESYTMTLPSFGFSSNAFQ